MWPFKYTASMKISKQACLKIEGFACFSLVASFHSVPLVLKNQVAEQLRQCCYLKMLLVQELGGVKGQW